MRGLLLCCLVALAACQSPRYDISLNPKKTYEYRYEGMVNFGLGMPNLAESGVKLTCKAKISGVSERTFLLQVSELSFSEYNGLPGENEYDASPKLSKRIAGELVKPFMFDYENGHVGDIRASTEISTNVVNIVRGILGFFQVTVKTTQNIYELEEIGIHGKCQSHYAIEENKETKEWNITQVVDVTNCREKAAMYTGMATAVVEKLSKERGESVVSTVRYVYSVKPTAEGGLITWAHGWEKQHFSPFNVKGGTFMMEAMKELVLLSVSDSSQAATHGPMESKGNIVYKFAEENNKIPIMMQDLEDPIPKVVNLIKRLAEANKYSVDSTTTEDSMKVYQLMRVIPHEGLETMWKQFADNVDHRRWFLDTIVEIGDAKVLKFLENRFKVKDLSPVEAWQTVLMVFEHLRADSEHVEMAKAFLEMPFSKSDISVWRTVALSYGSLVYKHCVYNTPCPVAAVQPLLDMATEALKSDNKDDMVLFLKALGNAGHPSSIKTIVRFLPVAATPVDLPLRVQTAAVEAMRLIAARDPHSVQDIAMSLFLEREHPTEVRMMAFMILFDTKPSMAVVSMITTHLLEEEDLHLASFAYSYLQGLARSRTPDNHFLSTASSVAAKILTPKFGRLGYRYSKAKHMDWFNHDLLAGTTSELFWLRSAANLLPTQIMSKGKFHFIGRIIELLELGVHLDGIKELFSINSPAFKGNFSISDVFAVLQNLEALPNDRPLVSAYSRVFGQEWYYTDVTKQLLLNILKAFSPSSGKGTPLWEVMENWQKGISWRFTRPFMVVEACFFQATTLGLPVEISKYYNTITAITVNAKAKVSPPPSERLGQLLSSEISVETDGFAGFTKDFWVFYGINTELFQSGSQLKNKAVFALPWKFSTKLNVAEKKFELDFPPCKEEIQLISQRSNVYAVSRNIEEPASPKVTPLMPSTVESINKNATAWKSEQILKASVWNPNSRMCAESKTYGWGLCAEYELKRQHYHEEYPLYYFLGYTQVALKVVPVQTTKPVDKIHFEINVGAPSLQMDTRQLLETLRNFPESVNSTPEAIFNFKAFAMSGKQKPEGYDAAVFYTPEEMSRSVQLIVSQVGANTNWKMCVDSSVNVTAEAKTYVRWGAECQTYEMSMEAAATYPPESELGWTARVFWTKIPEYMEEMGKRVESYIPGVAFLFGFNQENKENDEREVSASVVAASADSIDVKIKFPEYTVYRQAMPFPVTSISFEELPQNITTQQ